MVAKKNKKKINFKELEKEKEREDISDSEHDEQDRLEEEIYETEDEDY